MYYPTYVRSVHVTLTHAYFLSTRTRTVHNTLITRCRWDCHTHQPTNKSHTCYDSIIYDRTKISFYHFSLKFVVHIFCIFLNIHKIIYITRYSNGFRQAVQKTCYVVNKLGLKLYCNFICFFFVFVLYFIYIQIILVYIYVLHFRTPNNSTLISQIKSDILNLKKRNPKSKKKKS